MTTGGASFARTFPARRAPSGAAFRPWLVDFLWNEYKGAARFTFSDALAAAYAADGVRAVPLRNVKRGEFFTLAPVPFPSMSRVYRREEYDASARAFYACKCSDVWGDWRTFKGARVVYVGFTF
jgi:hypothetical protein